MYNMTSEERKQKQEVLNDDILSFHKCVRRPEGTPPEELILTMDSLHDFLQKVIDTPVGIRRKLVILYKYVNVYMGTDI